MFIASLHTEVGQFVKLSYGVSIATNIITSCGEVVGHGARDYAAGGFVHFIDLTSAGTELVKGLPSLSRNCAVCPLTVKKSNFLRINFLLLPLRETPEKKSHLLEELSHIDFPNNPLVRAA